MLNFDLNSLKKILSGTVSTERLTNVTGVILAAGFGKRMRELTQKIAKPLLPMLNCPVVGWSIAQMRDSGVRKIVMNTHYLSESFELLKPIIFDAGMTLKLVQESKLTGPFGGVMACSQYIEDGDDLLVFTGDGLFEFDINKLLYIHRHNNAELTMGVAKVTDGSRYGVVNVNPNGVVLSMQEKPKGVGPVDTASCGIYVVSAKVIKRMAAIPLPLDWIDVVTLLLNENRVVMAENVELWMDAGTPQDLISLNKNMLVPERLSRIAEHVKETHKASVWVQDRVSNIENAIFEKTVLIGSDVFIGHGTTVCNSIIGPHSTIGQNVEIRDSVILSGANIPDSTKVINAIIIGK